MSKPDKAQTIAIRKSGAIKRGALSVTRSGRAKRVDNPLAD